MVLAYQNRHESQDYLAHKLAVKPGLGTPIFQVNRLKELNIKVVYEEGTLDILREWVARGLPVIVFVQAGELSYWSGELFQHAVVVIGVAETLSGCYIPIKQTPPFRYRTMSLCWLGKDGLFVCSSEGRLAVALRPRYHFLFIAKTQTGVSVGRLSTARFSINNQPSDLRPIYWLSPT